MWRIGSFDEKEGGLCVAAGKMIVAGLLPRVMGGSTAQMFYSVKSPAPVVTVVGRPAASRGYVTT